MRNDYERLKHLDEEHDKNVDEKKKQVESTFEPGKFTLDLSTAKTFAAIEAEVKKISFMKLYEDVYTTIVESIKEGNGLKPVNILDKLDKKNYNFAQKVGFFTVGTTAGIAVGAVGAVGATGVVVSAPFIELYNYIKDKTKDVDVSKSFHSIVDEGKQAYRNWEDKRDAERVKKAEKNK